jgi:hypothetical protein
VGDDGGPGPRHRDDRAPAHRRDAFDDDLKNDATTKDALWVLRQSYIFLPGGNRPTNQANLIAPTKLEDGVWSGNYLAVAVAAGAVPGADQVRGDVSSDPHRTSARVLVVAGRRLLRGCGGEATAAPSAAAQHRAWGRQPPQLFHPGVRDAEELAVDVPPCRRGDEVFHVPPRRDLDDELGLELLASQVGQDRCALAHALVDQQIGSNARA